MELPVQEQSPDQRAEGDAAPLAYDFDNSLLYHLARASNLMAFGADPGNRKHYGVNVREWRVLAVLGSYQPITSAGVVEVTGLDKATVSRALEALDRKGMIRRAPHPEDGRASLLSLTEAGVELNNRIVPEATAQGRAYEAGLEPRERAELLRLLAKLMDHARLVNAGKAGT